MDFLVFRAKKSMASIIAFPIDFRCFKVSSGFVLKLTQLSCEMYIADVEIKKWWRKSK